MRIVLAAPLAVFFQLKLFLNLFLIARGVVVDPVTVSALEFDEIILGHEGKLIKEIS